MRSMPYIFIAMVCAACNTSAPSTDAQSQSDDAAQTAVAEPTSQTLQALAAQELIAAGASVTDNNDGTLTFAIGSQNFTVLATSGGSNGNVKGYFTGFGAPPAMVALFVDSADVQAAIVAEDSDVRTAGGYFERKSETTLPTKGTATFNGKYLGHVFRNDVNLGYSRLGSATGDVQLNVDFGADTVSGRISNRQDGLKETMEDIALTNGTLADNGSFTGTATGGETTEGGTRPIISAGVGTFAGVISGATGTDITAGVSVTHTIKQNGVAVNEQITEHGLISASR